MRKRIRTEELKKGMIIAEPVLHGSNILLDRGIKLTQDYIEKIKKRNIRSVYISIEKKVNKKVVKVEKPRNLKEEKILNQIDEIEISKISFEDFRIILDQSLKIGTNKIINRFAKLAYISDGKIRKYLCEKLIDKADLTELFLRGLKSSDNDFKKLCIKFLKTTPDPSYIKNMLLSMRNNKEIINYEIIQALKSFDDNDVIKNAYDILKDQPEYAAYIIQVLNGYESLDKINKLKEKYLNIKIPDKKVNKVKNIPKNVKKEEKEIIIEKVKEKVLETKTAENVYHQSEVVERREIKNEIQLKLTDYSKDFSVNREEDNILFEIPKDIDISSNNGIMKMFTLSIGKLDYFFEQIYKDIYIDSRSFNEIANQIVYLSKNKFKELMEFTKVSTIKNYILGHSVNTAMVSVILGTLKGWDEHKLSKLAVAALLHDIGMVKVETLLWNDKRKISKDERFIIKKHSIYGIDSLRKLTKFPTDVCYPAYYHHERIDGTGYPNGRKGHLIDEFSKIISIADVYCALMSKRLWRAPFSHKETFLEILNGSFDNSIVDIWKNFVVENIDNSISALSSSKAKKVLVVDDQEDILIFITNLLKTKGYNVSKAYSAQEALRKMQVIQPDIILLDIMMPIIDGFEAVKYFRKFFKKINREIPIVLVTARRDSESILKARSVGITDYVIKPFTSNVLLAKIASVLLRSQKK